MSTRLEEALALLAQGDYPRGEEALSSVIGDSSEDFSTHHQARAARAFMRLQLGRFSEAADDYRQLVVERPDDIRLGLQLAETLCQGRDGEGAFSATMEVLRRDPTNSRATLLLWAAQNLIAAKGTSAMERPAAEPIPAGPFNPALRTLENDPKSSFPTSVFPEVGRLIYALVRATQPNVVVETGSYVGYSSICMAQALQDMNKGHLHCFDLFDEVARLPDGSLKYVSPILGERASHLDIAREHLAAAGLGHRATLYKGDSSSQLHEAISKLGTPIDFAFIDGDHTIPGCLLDWYAVDEFAREGALIVLHDTNPEHCKWMSPRYLMEKMKERSGNEYQWINVPTYDKMGLAVIQKIGTGTSSRFRPTLLELARDYLFTRRYWSFWTGQASVKRARE